MKPEIERKFLVCGEFKSQAHTSTHITQGYLSSVPERTVRVRIKAQKGYITIKGKSNQNGTCRLEWEKEITITDAHELLKICEPGIIDKTRYCVKIGKHIYEIDEFHGENQGLILAEIELNNEHENFIKPDWLGTEVTGDEKYYNAYLSQNPYTHW